MHLRSFFAALRVGLTTDRPLAAERHRLRSDDDAQVQLARGAPRQPQLHGRPAPGRARQRDRARPGDHRLQRGDLDGAEHGARCRGRGGGRRSRRWRGSRRPRVREVRVVRVRGRRRRSRDRERERPAARGAHRQHKLAVGVRALADARVERESGCRSPARPTPSRRRITVASDAATVSSTRSPIDQAARRPFVGGAPTRTVSGISSDAAGAQRGRS